MLGGTQSLHTNSYDEALALPTEEAVRVALRTQQIIAHESGVTNTIDPLGGSYFVEKLTDEMEAPPTTTSRRIDELGGMVEAIKPNFPQREIADAVLPLPAGGRRRASGSSSASTTSSRRTTSRPRSCASTRRSSASRSIASRRPRAARDSAAVESALAELQASRRDRGRNLMPPIIDAARARATEGEMIAALQEVFGTYTEPPVF